MVFLSHWLSEVRGVSELRESYDVHTPDGAFPDHEIASLRPTVRTIFEKCKSLTYRILTAMAIALGLDRSYFCKRHQQLASADNSSCMRLLYYPASPTPRTPPRAPPPAAAPIRITALLPCYSKTLVVAWRCVKERGGAWVSAQPIPGTILVNAGDILQFWTADHFRATEHRVLLSGARNTARQSVVFFVHPDGEVVVAPVDGSGRYAARTAQEHTTKRFSETYSF
ncbi:UPF0676 protein C1494.01 [Chionoecetes opilio]|uniref:UPF0676 protein C1494.01 n=1 Tax=Chionoecetes opilio TaxID=41210 RepID=A0A8J4YFW1_CHIOP|nr:UPF0676 protein C1494.01 [Chionoecetes opilio]